MKKITTLLLLFRCATALAQNNPEKLSVEELLRFKLPRDTVQIIYYAFYNGLQMVELDFASPYKQRIMYLEQTKPRAMPHAALEPMPRPNIYLLRDSNGTIIKSYNLYGLDIDKLKLKHPRKLAAAALCYHSKDNFLRSAAVRRYQWPGEADQRDYQPQDVYIIAEGGSIANRRRQSWLPVGAKFGLIDTLGNVIVLPKYDYIEPFMSAVTVVKLGNGLGLLDHHGKEVLPCRYEWIKTEEGVAVVRMPDKRYRVYNKMGERVTEEDYEGEINFFQGTSRVYIKRKGYGIIDKRGRIICPLEYDYIEELSQAHPDGTRWYYARKGGEEFRISQAGEVKVWGR
jgi:hypothetical protein